MIPVAAVIVTKDEEAALPRCLSSLSIFPQIFVVDSASTDRTPEIAQAHGVTVVPYEWNGAYPKKRQWCLDYLPFVYDWVFFIDADEEMTPELAAEITRLFADGAPSKDGYFVRGRYVDHGVVLRYGLHNNKLVLFRRGAFAFPVVDDLGLPMGEIEGHYQPVGSRNIGQLHAPVLHYATDDRVRWLARHRKYATWEAGMNRRDAWPVDPVPVRQMMKRIFRALPLRGVIAFVHAYIFRAGLLNGPAGWRQARDRYLYYTILARAMRERDQGFG